eukprot:CAMPEP_0119552934 /NCGR_PEP_ID=MMETSP1352-20130426/5805_1 /TAXON_ID=265584 /ORGANISM="Stauroneis constricta, Strain CCMP1120" /LENGTH=99 /DNA_ID=CAMNT_0007599251 /DNA_START=783 /DNA_END=1079 /DNA_ORIENTATION=-
MNRAQVAILKQPDEMRFGRLLQRQDRRALPAVRPPGQILLDFSYQPCEGQPPQQQVRRVLQMADLRSAATPGLALLRRTPAAGARLLGCARERTIVTLL